MKIGTILAGVLLFAAVTAVLYGWGLLRSRDESRLLLAKLTGRCEKKILCHVRRSGAVTLQEAARLLEGTSVSLFYSRRRFGVTDSEAFSAALLDKMEAKGLLRKEELQYRWAGHQE